MAEKEPQPTQKTQPKKGEPVEIPVPTREEWLRNLEKIAPREALADDTTGEQGNCSGSDRT